MKPADIINSEAPEVVLSELIHRLHTDGPVDPKDLETLAYLKYFHRETFLAEEKKIMYLLGLFYKTDDPNDLLSLSYSIFSQTILAETGQKFTPVQASIRNKIQYNKYFSFSAPTSTGKSFLFRELIKDQVNDIVIVVPSRALIAEYILAVREIVEGRNDILILQFIDDVNKRKTSRKIFIVTPERASDIFKTPERFNPSLFLYDEAQISEEKTRGVSFDALVRRADRVFPDAKKVFAHPFIVNPEAQLIKHDFDEESDAVAYNQSTVGKIYLGYDRNKSKFELFSPFIEGCHLISNKEDFTKDIVEEILLSGGSLLVYISKTSIYEKRFEDDFEYYISLCNIITSPEAIEIVDEIEELIGAKGKSSELVDLMKRGVVIHHGSIPLAVRFLIEKFTNAGFAKICFATSTLAQGVNMPFDIVWIENSRFSGSNEDKTLGLKNLIGRAGRSTSVKNSFDYGYVIVKNIREFISRFNGTSRLAEQSLIETDPDSVPEDLSEFINAVKNDDFNDSYNLPNCKTKRLESASADKLIKFVLDFLFTEGKIINGNTYQESSDSNRRKLKTALAGIYEISLGRGIFVGEKTVLSASITILLWQIQGKSFKELLGLRYSYLTNQKQQRKYKKQARRGKITPSTCKKLIDNIAITYSAIPYSLPNSTLKSRLPSRFQYKKMKDFNYDLVVYDTYDFLDKVISFSLSDIFIAAFDQYYVRTSDSRANEMVNYFRYGTNNKKEIWLIRYGFSIEEAELIKTYVVAIDENEILFSTSINEPQNQAIRQVVSRYL